MGTEVPLSEEPGQQGRAKAEVSLDTKANKLTEQKHKIKKLIKLSTAG